MKLLIHSCDQVVTVIRDDDNRSVLTGPFMRNIQVLEQDIAIAVDEDGTVPSTADARVRWNDSEFEDVIDAKGKCVLPGFVDAHTHPVWAGDRVHEFAMKLAGATYLEIHEAGGGIHFTVDKTVKTSQEDLYQSLKDRLTKMLNAGTTTVECKTGYGLEMDAELKLLEVLQRAKRELPIEISITFCGAHAVPRNKTAEEATKDIVKQQIPRLRNLMVKQMINIENIDVFCEKGIFDTEQSKRILEAGRDIGLRINFHGDELNPIEETRMGAEIGATAISHLEEVSEQGIEDMAAAAVVAVLLPTTAYIMKLNPPPTRQLIEQAVPVALGSDFNPNAYCFDMATVMNLACIILGMSMQEALVAATLNAAASLGRGKTHGAIQKGRIGDFVIINTNRWEHIIYQMSSHHHLIDYVVKKGKVVYRKDENH
ncbi:hypothetical protein L9F63_023726 [Diploptera punctata]|uniref:Probable imidazolonepropionase n=1 Tax=Diploptera punctata TaxID=6984 RepID=A0AAD7ZI42_DIPPU|nr:hypothetical protein L9F63_023726 [Diploptera punctata]